MGCHRRSPARNMCLPIPPAGRHHLLLDQRWSSTSLRRAAAAADQGGSDMGEFVEDDAAPCARPRPGGWGKRSSRRPDTILVLWPVTTLTRIAVAVELRLRSAASARTCQGPSGLRASVRPMGSLPPPRSTQPGITLRFRPRSSVGDHRLRCCRSRPTTSIGFAMAMSSRIYGEARQMSTCSWLRMQCRCARAGLDCSLVRVSPVTTILKFSL